MLGHSAAVETKIDIYIENGPDLTMLPGIFVWLFTMAPLNVEHEYHWSQQSHLCQPHSDPLSNSSSAVTHQTCLLLWTWRKLADETNVKNTPKICGKIVLT